MACTLDTLPPGRSAVVLRVGSNGAVGQRLHEMGLLEGETVRMVRAAPMGDPLEIEIQGFLLSLRRKDAGLIVIQPL
jgi:ferrous iron transport protein A